MSINMARFRKAKKGLQNNLKSMVSQRPIIEAGTSYQGTSISEAPDDFYENPQPLTTGDSHFMDNENSQHMTFENSQNLSA